MKTPALFYVALCTSCNSFELNWIELNWIEGGGLFLIKFPELNFRNYFLILPGWLVAINNNVSILNPGIFLYLLINGMESSS